MPIRPITVAEYHRMARAGILSPREPVELLDGQLIAMPPIGPAHDFAVRRLHAWLQTTFAGRAAVGVQAPLTLGDRSEPQPDLMLNALPDVRYARAHATAGDTLLVVEVSLTSLAFDRERKRRAYARHGIPEYWLIDLAQESVEVFRRPAGDDFTERSTVPKGRRVAPLAFPDDSIPVEMLFAPPER